MRTDRRVNGTPALAAVTGAVPGPDTSSSSEWLTVRTSSICPSETNPRKTRDSSKLEELANSIRKHGILQPILVRVWPMRSKGEEAYEIIAGERRWRAAKLAELLEVPVRVVQMDDKAVLEVQVIENLQREDVHPLEEADGFQALIRNYQYTAAHIAEKIGCHESYVQKRLRLAKLIEPARKAFAAGDISLQHCIFIARLDVEQQKQAFGMCIREVWHQHSNGHMNQAIPASILDARIRAEILLDLSSAPWKKDDPALVPKAGPCTTCPKRTGSNAQLFDDFTKGDHCLDKDCFETKRRVFVDVKIAELAGKNKVEPVRVATEWADGKMLQKLGAVSHHDVKAITKKDRCASAEAAIVVYGNDVGHTMEVCRDAKCKMHHPYGASAYQRSGQELADERKRKVEEKINVAYRRELWLRTANQLEGPLDRGALDLIAAYLMERIGHDLRAEICKSLGLEPKKRDSFSDYAAPLLGHYNKLSDKPAAEGFLLALALAPSLSIYANADKQIIPVAKSIGLDPAAIRKEIAAPILAKAKQAADRLKAKAAAAKKAGKKAAPVADAKRAAANDVDGDDEWEEGDE